METNTHLIEFIPGAKAKASDVNFNFKNLNDAVNLSKQSIKQINDDIAEMSQLNEEALEQKSDIDLSNITDTGKNVIGENVSASNNSDNLISGAFWGGTYTAPGNGFYFLNAGNNDGRAASISIWGLVWRVASPLIGHGKNLITPLMSKGDQISIWVDTNAVGINEFRFIYSKGSQLENDLEEDTP